jgi:NAD-dependent SIR2 family protein deacetylase
MVTDSRRRRRRPSIQPMEMAQVTCPTCFEVFDVAMPHLDEMPTEVDYDCEICCRPMIIVFTEEEVYAKGLGD